jgi:hypothetical protein
MDYLQYLWHILVHPSPVVVMIPQSFRSIIKHMLHFCNRPRPCSDSYSISQQRGRHQAPLASDFDHIGLPTLHNSSDLIIIQCFHRRIKAWQNLMKHGYTSLPAMNRTPIKAYVGLINYFTTPLVVWVLLRQGFIDNCSIKQIIGMRLLDYSSRASVWECAPQ